MSSNKKELQQLLEDMGRSGPESLHSEHKDWLVCNECGQVQYVVALEADHALMCFNCGAELSQSQSRWFETVIALAFAALALFIISMFFPILTLEIGTQSQSVTIVDGFWALFQRNNFILAALILATLVLFPLFEICALLYLVLPYYFNRRLRGQATVLRWFNQAQSWSMLEIFLLSMVVGSIKMADMAHLELEVGSYALFLLVAILILANLKLSRMKFWAWINTNNYFTTEVGEEVLDCTSCNALVGRSIVESGGLCPRCGSEVHERIPHSLEKTTALTLAAAILYIPANILPIMTYTSLGEVSTDTIFSGVVSLIANDLWGIAIIVFVASIVVPILKLVILTYLIVAVKWRIRVGARHRAWLYRLTEFIGRWSMVDVFVVTIFVALVQFGFIYTVEAEGAIIAFGAVVVITMVAAETFDPRLIWDAREQQHGKTINR
ncbi:paraquat-inducible protein A [Agaribacterium haliotis]|uniref:paraquat-inducible protein A n=1 Tax=Agaribacterium haliotis TaxID=2013869 RepID=UPI001EFD91BE|nr:PqiA/YebS family transporter subunit [Agaribacterium haliotis]